MDIIKISTCKLLFFGGQGLGKRLFSTKFITFGQGDLVKMRSSWTDVIKKVDLVAPI